MSISHDVENQRFRFENEWAFAFKYDDCDFYKKEATRLQGHIDGVSHSTKAVDLIGLHDSSGLLLLEAKDFRGHRIANKPRIANEISVEVAVKVRDTVASLVGAARKPVTEFPSERIADTLKKGKHVDVVLWLEDDTLRNEKVAKAKLGPLNQKLKSALSWLNVQTYVLTTVAPNRINGLTVTNLPGAGQPNS